ncbi:MAG: LacI family DNA-binding transcriptional regulator, partial [Propioniciclava sp.]
MTRPTLKDVAQRAGVSHATASKALNGRTEIAEETRALVARAASELGY